MTKARNEMTFCIFTVSKNNNERKKLKVKAPIPKLKCEIEAQVLQKTGLLFYSDQTSVYIIFWLSSQLASVPPNNIAVAQTILDLETATAGLDSLACI